ncbi:MAG: Rieske 2Fe-2S domain-containing protein [Planctomycetes bacterium]|nr:Rieske 2Fe-2S domain-containing protein [Planctomycetota bacterium]
MAPSREDTPSGDPPAQAGGDERRNFLVQASAIVIGGIVGFVPPLIGLWNFLNPLLRSKPDDKVDEAVRIATLDDISEIGKVYRFQLSGTRIDAWSKYSGRIGAGYVCRESEDPNVKPKVFTAVCPHLGCSVDYKEDREQFVCPCHNGTFAKDGSLVDPETATPPRGLDELEDVEIRNDNELWVVYKRFRSGIEAKIEE